MTTVKIPHHARVLVADGRKALVLRNEGGPFNPNLTVEHVLEAPDNPPTSEQGSDEPGRTQTQGRRSAVGQTDWHAAAEAAFASKVAEEIDRLCARENVRALIVVAPPKALADLRGRFTDAVRKLIVAEIDKDLTKHPVGEIQRHLS
ncbi:host attachment protein [Aurantimonas sp. A3-2-R12]|uniref:host attachment protein n=1 Tax=Aurantimonas sp. A3-2-R12 TaxID=3114362 RepID=UPI002E178861|nr:host attachment protein [Aurantimonas sp. A3-2-R12]